jgi:hypothetical protein
MFLLIRLWIRGFIESRGDCGLSFDGPTDPRTVAYDKGRSFGRRTIARGFDEEEVCLCGAPMKDGVCSVPGCVCSK